MNFVMQSSVDKKAKLHVAIIMDGNGRWATRRGLPRPAGHRRGMLAAQRLVQAAPGLGVTMLTLFAFSSDNWRRPGAEVDALMSLLRHYLVCEVWRLVENGVRLTVIGRRDRLPDGLSDSIYAAEQASIAGRRLHLRIAIDYSSREAIANALRGSWYSAGCDGNQQVVRTVHGGHHAIPRFRVVRHENQSPRRTGWRSPTTETSGGRESTAMSLAASTPAQAE